MKVKDLNTSTLYLHINIDYRE